MKVTTICFLLRDNKVVLAMKKRGHGEGKWNGYGGKLNEGESVEDSAVREIKEESGIDIDKNILEKVAEIDFLDDGEISFHCPIFLIKEWSGEPIETDEMNPKWFDVDKIPYNEMWSTDKIWMPLVFSGKKIKAQAYFIKGTNTMTDFKWEEIG